MKRYSLLAIPAVLSALSAQQHVLCPDFCHLTESTNPTTSAVGSLNWWGTTAAGRHFQVLYESSHFTTKSPVIGPISINEISFRGEDFEPNTGGQTFGNVTVNVYSTVLTATTMSTTDQAANIAGSTLISSATIPVVTVLASLGTVPNNYFITLPVVPSGTYDPTLGNSILVDIDWTSFTAAPTGIGMINTQDSTTSGIYTVRGRGIYKATPGAGVGTTSTSPPIVDFGFAGAGGSATLIPARTENAGASCGGSPSSFYQFWPAGTRFDLANQSITLVPDTYPSPNFYTVLPGGAAFDPLQVNATPNSVADDGVVTFTMGSAFEFPGGSTTVIKPSTNGFVWLNATDTSTDLSSTIVEFLGASVNHGARIALCWSDLHAGRNTVTNPNSGLHVLDVGTDTYVTWFNIGRFNSTAFGGQSVNDMQLKLDRTSGTIEMRWGQIGEQWGGCLTGFSRGRIGGSAGTPSVDPGSMDLSAELTAGPFPPAYQTRIEGTSGNVLLTAASTALAAGNYGARWFGGQSVTFNLANVPVGTVIAYVLLDAGQSVPGVQLPGITAPGCRISTTLSPVFFETHILPTSSVTGLVSLPIPHDLDGSQFTAQAISLDGLFGGPNLVTWASNSIVFTAGRQ